MCNYLIVVCSLPSTPTPKSSTATCTAYPTRHQSGRHFRVWRQTPAQLHTLHFFMQFSSVCARHTLVHRMHTVSCWGGTCLWLFIWRTTSAKRRQSVTVSLFSLLCRQGASYFIPFFFWLRMSSAHGSKENIGNDWTYL